MFRMNKVVGGGGGARQSSGNTQHGASNQHSRETPPGIASKSFSYHSTPEAIVRRVEAPPEPMVGDTQAETMPLPPSLYAIPIVDGNNYEQLGHFFEFRVLELDNASGATLDFMDIGDAGKSGNFYKERRSTAERLGDERSVAAYASEIHATGRATWHRQNGMAQLARILELSADDQPCLVFVRPGRMEPLEILSFDPAWYVSPAARKALGSALRQWLLELKLDGAAPAGGEGDPFERTVHAAVEGLRTAISLSVSGAVPSDQQSLFYREGDVWRLAFEGQHAGVKDSVGMTYLCDLLAKPGWNVPAHALRVSRTAVPDLLTFTGGEILDAKAIAAIKARIGQIETLRVDAVESGAAELVEELDEEDATLQGQLGAATGLGGRPRSFSSDSNAARTAVSMAITRAIKHIKRSLPVLGEHLEITVKMGSMFSYLPNPQPHWILRASPKRNKS